MARNALVKAARRCEPRPTHLMFIDQDCILATDTISHLLSFNKPVIGATYYQKNPPYKPCVYHIKPTFGMYDDDFPGPDSEPFQVKDGGIGMGATLIRMDVFDQVEKKLGNQMWYQCPSSIVKDEKGEDREMIMGEDIFFCNQLNETGIEIWCDPSDRVEHAGYVQVCGELFRSTLEARKEMAG